MSAPKRIQLRRTKGWRKPEGAIVVARPSKWGNPYRADDYPRAVWIDDDPHPTPTHPVDRRRWAVVDFTSLVKYQVGTRSTMYPSLAEIRAELAGRDLACWCPLDQPCHADVLLDLANEATR